MRIACCLLVCLFAFHPLTADGKSKTLTQLRKQLKSKKATERKWAVRSLRHRAKDSSTARRLIKKALKDKDQGVRIAALDALRSVGKPADFKLVKRLLKDKEPDVRRASVRASHKLGGDKGVKASLKLLKDKNKYVRRAVLSGVAYAKPDPSYVKRCEKLLGDADSGVRTDAVSAYARHAEPAKVVERFGKLLKTETDKWTLARIYSRLAWTKHAGVVDLALEGLSQKEEHARKAALDAVRRSIRHAPDRAQAVVKTLLTHAWEQARVAGVSLARTRKEAPLTRTLVTMVTGDRVEEVRKECASALGSLLYRKETAPLKAEVIAALKVAASDKTEGVRSAALLALVNQLDDAAFFGKFVNDPNKYVRSRALYGLSSIGGEANAKVVAAALADDAEGWVRKNAAEYLGRMKLERAALEKAAADDSDRKVRDAAKRALKRFKK